MRKINKIISKIPSCLDIKCKGVLLAAGGCRNKTELQTQLIKLIVEWIELMYSFIPFYKRHDRTQANKQCPPTDNKRKTNSGPDIALRVRKLQSERRVECPGSWKECERRLRLYASVWLRCGGSWWEKRMYVVRECRSFIINSVEHFRQRVIRADEQGRCLPATQSPGRSTTRHCLVKTSLPRPTYASSLTALPRRSLKDESQPATNIQGGPN